MKQKTAAIYDRWLHTLGGGEQVAFAYAQALSEMGYKVDLVTHKLIDPDKAEKKMGISLKKINIKYIEESSSKELSGLSGKYDVFINTSHLDYFPNRSKNGILSVFFPGTIRLSVYEYLKRALFVPSFRKLFIYPSYYEGFAFDQYQNGKIYKWLSKESSIVFKDNIDKVSLTFYLEYFTFAIIDQMTFIIDEKEIKPDSKTINDKENLITFSFHLKNTKKKKLTINMPKHPYDKKVALISLTISGFRFFLYNVFKELFPVWEMRLHGGPGITKMSDLQSYSKIVTISEFCKKWINKYWGLDSEILYPPVNTNNFEPAKKKKNIILHVGRFFITGHSKKQLELAKAFVKMANKNNIADWELHFVGSVAEGSTHKNYFNKVINESKGYPIHFHNNASFSELKQLFSNAKIYWHATGLDEDEDRNPLAMEHFGITTVEAMASGCVPVVINKGGQKEIVTNGYGFTWSNREELISQTMTLINDPKKLNKFSEGAIQRSKYFSKEKFKIRFKEIIESK
jgi:glycosyltransferase involved in cell wall biosynthesis